MSTKPINNKIKEEKINEWKELVADDRYRIKLYDKVANELKELLNKKDKDLFSVDESVNDEVFRCRVSKYEQQIFELCNPLILMSYWGTPTHDSSLLLPFKRYGNSLSEIISGKKVWINLNWYPLHYLIYSIGISAVASNRFDHLKKIFDLQMVNKTHSNSKEPLIFILATCIISELNDSFGKAYSNKGLTPISDYLFKSLREKMESFFYMGEEYENYFDKFELIFTLEYIHKKNGESIDYIWGPLGRFSLKMSYGQNPLSRLVEESKQMGNNWPPIKAGFFNGDYDRFKFIASKFKEWHGRRLMY